MASRGSSPREVRREPIEVEARQHDPAGFPGRILERQREVEAALLRYEANDLVADGKGVGRHGAPEVGAVRVQERARGLPDVLQRVLPSASFTASSM